MTDRESRKKQITEQRQQQILKAAGEVFTRKGYAATTVPEIAKLADVAVGPLYNYYPSKRETFIAVIKNFIITVPLLDLIGKMPEADFAVTFRQILHNRLNLIESEAVFWIPSLMGEIQRDTELKALWAEQFIQPFFKQMEEVYHVMMASGKFRRMEPSVATRAIGGLILGFLMLKVMEGETSPLKQLPKEAVADALTDFVLHGLTADTEAKKS